MPTNGGLTDAVFSAMLYSMWQIDPRMGSPPRYEYREVAAVPPARHNFTCTSVLTLGPGPDLGEAEVEERGESLETSESFGALKIDEGQEPEPEVGL